MTTPKTEAGRIMLDWFDMAKKRTGWSGIPNAGAILAIEAQALQDALKSGRYLDLESEEAVERLARLLPYGAVGNNPEYRLGEARTILAALQSKPKP